MYTNLFWSTIQLKAFEITKERNEIVINKEFRNKSTKREASTKQKRLNVIPFRKSLFKQKIDNQ